ncbi:MAG: hypothetical protein R2684_00750 [Pyrinomonadaceae bacterium]
MTANPKSVKDAIGMTADAMGPDWLPEIYRKRVRKGRTRAFDLSLRPTHHDAEILHTLLGIQLRVGGKLISCPDLATARYLRVFARAGCSSVAVPYDIRSISAIADDLESSWQRTMLVFSSICGKSFAPSTEGRRRAALVRAIRDEVSGIGTGEAVPKFETETRQRIRK